MTRSKYLLVALCSTLSGVAAFGSDILLRLQPDAATPVVTRIVATEKVLLDAAPVPGKPDWQQLKLLLPLEGYVPTATLSKNFEIVENTPVHFLPNATSFELSIIEPGDAYEIGRVEEEWTRISFKKTLTGYFLDKATPTEVETPEVAEFETPEPPTLELPSSPEPIREARFDPSANVGMRSLDELPPENVVWKTAPRSPAPIRQPQPQAIDPIPAAPVLADGIMVGPGETQAREAITSPTPDTDKPLRLLTGILVREIRSDASSYPIQLRSPEGRLIAYVNFSDLFINDLAPFLDQRVFIRGHIMPLRPNDSQLVIFAREIRLAQ